MTRSAPRHGPAFALALALVGAGAAHAQGAPIVLDGDVPDDDGDFFSLPFAVPAGTVEIQIAHDDLSDENILDWGVWDPAGAFRGWGGGNTEDAIVGVSASSRSYLAGPIPAGTWEVVVGKAKIARPPGSYHVEIVLRDVATLTPDPARGPYDATTLATEARFYAGDFHVHSRESGDADATLDDIADYARGVGLDFVVITDHNTESHVGLLSSAQGRHPELLFIPGAEFTTYGGHVGAYGAITYVDHRIGDGARTIADAFADFDDDVLLAVNHPVLDLGDVCIGCAWAYGDEGLDRANAVEIMTGGSVLFLADALAFWDSKLDRGFTLAPVGGSDDHRAGQGTGFAQSPIGTPTTMVYATSLAPDAILAGVKNGLTVVQLGGVDGPMVELEMDPPRTTARIEREVTAEDQSILVEARVRRAAGRTVALLRDGFPVDDATRTPASDDEIVSWTVDAPADEEHRYRVEVWDDDHPVTVTGHVWITSRLPSPDAGGCGCATTRGDAPRALLGAALGALLVARRRRRRRASVAR